MQEQWVCSCAERHHQRAPHHDFGDGSVLVADGDQNVPTDCDESPEWHKKVSILASASVGRGKPFVVLIPPPKKKWSRNGASSHVLEYRVQHYCYHYSYPLNLIQVPHLERAAWLCPGPVAAIVVSAVCNLAFLNRICADGDFPVPGPWHVVPTA